jgi:acyl transferase domain-containing protein
VEEYVADQAHTPRRSSQHFLLALSGKTEKALETRIDDLIGFLEGSRESSSTLEDISFSLLEGRNHFNYRCAIVVPDRAAAINSLKRARAEKMPNVFRAKVARDFKAQPVLQQYAEDLLVQRNHEPTNADRYREALLALADLYCQGYLFTWSMLFSSGQPRKVRLPTYPFARDRYWKYHDGTNSPVRVKAESAQSTSIEKAQHLAENAETDATLGTLMLAPVWDVVSPESSVVAPAKSERVIVVGGSARDTSAIRSEYGKVVDVKIGNLDSIETIKQRLNAVGPIDHIIWFAPEPAGVTSLEAFIDAQRQGVIPFFRLVKALLQSGYDSGRLGWTVITTQTQAVTRDDLIDPSHGGIHGFVGSLVKEFPNWRVRLVDLNADSDRPISELFSLPSDRRGNAWVYRYGEWYRRQLVPVKTNDPVKTRFRTGGVYIVIGGAGDIGQAWSEYVASNYGAQIVWVGRRAKDATIQAKLDRLVVLGRTPSYITADATQLSDMERVRSDVLASYGNVHGVIHAAMVFANQSIAEMEETELHSALSAKVDVSVRLAQVFGNDTLDFVLFFSSMISFIKNPKQSHYAAGCTFKDAFAHYLAEQWRCPVKVVNWGYWDAEKNARASEVQQLLNLGLGLIDPRAGMRALEILLSSSLQQLGVMHIAKSLEVEGINTHDAITIYSTNGQNMTLEQAVDVDSGLEVQQ